MTQLALAMLAIVAAAWAMGRLAAVVGQPRVMGEITAGVLLGPTVLGHVSLTALDLPGLACEATTLSACLFSGDVAGHLDVLGKVGLALYLYLVGRRIDLTHLRAAARPIAVLTAGSVIVPALAGLALGATLLHQPLFAATNATPLAVGLAVGTLLCVTALPVMARILEETELEPQVQAMALATGASATVLMFALLALSTGVTSGTAPGPLAARVLASLLLPLVVILVTRTVVPADDGRRGVLPSIVIMGLLAAAATAGDQLGASVIPAAFAVGFAAPRAPGGFLALLDQRLGRPTMAVLLPVFIATAGLRADLTALPGAAIPGLAILLVVAVVSKAVGVLVAARATGLSWQDGALFAVLMNCRGLLVLVVGISALAGDVITPALYTGAILVALVTTAMTGPLVARQIRLREQAGERTVAPVLAPA